MSLKDPEARREYHRKYMAKRRADAAYKEEQNMKTTERRRANIEEHRAADAEYKRTYRKKNGEKARAADKANYAANPARKKQTVAKRRARTSNTFGTKESVSFVYHAAQVLEEEYGTKWEVDHIIPLNGVNVSGLHVAHNLQLLSPEDNRAKSNKV